MLISALNYIVGPLTSLLLAEKCSGIGLAFQTSPNLAPAHSLVSCPAIASILCSNDCFLNIHCNSLTAVSGYALHLLHFEIHLKCHILWMLP